MAGLFLFGVFRALGGGTKAEEERDTAVVTGLNLQLPAARSNPKEDQKTKDQYYEESERDSARRRQWMQQDPYRRKEGQVAAGRAVERGNDTVVDRVGDSLLHALKMIGEKLDAPAELSKRPVAVRAGTKTVRVVSAPVRALPAPVRATRNPPNTDSPAMDPELHQLNEMVDKLVRLQQGGAKLDTIDARHDAAPAAYSVAGEKGMPVTAMPVAIPAVVVNDQSLMNGGTVALRLQARVSVNRIELETGQLVYGQVAISGDRMQVHIQTLRKGNAILSVSWQVFDLDGMAGVRIPDGLARQSLRQTADQTMGAVGMTMYEPTIGGQMASAGIQAARSLVGRRVRAIRVTMPAGYQVLIRDSKAGSSQIAILDSVKTDSSVTIAPPPVDEMTPFLRRRVKDNRVELTLSGIYLCEERIWLRLAIANHRSVSFGPAYVRCTIRQGRHVRRMAMQDMPVAMLYDSLPEKVRGGEEALALVGLSPLELGRDSRLIVQMGDGPGSALLEVSISSKVWKKMRSTENNTAYEKEK